LFQNVAFAPLGYINAEHLVIDQAAAEVCALIRMRQFNAKSMYQLRPYLGWNIIGIRRIYIVVEHQVPEQHFPMIANQAHQPLPVKLPLGAIDHMANIGAIKALTSCDKNL